jgi:hypothetical protein
MFALGHTSLTFVGVTLAVVGDCLPVVRLPLAVVGNCLPLVGLAFAGLALAGLAPRGLGFALVRKYVIRLRRCASRFTFHASKHASSRLTMRRPDGPATVSRS